MLTWVVWFLAAQVSIYEVSINARVESSEFVHVVDSPVAGTVIEVHVEVDDEVRKGDPLVVLDTKREASLLEGVTANVYGIAARLRALRDSRMAELEAATSRNNAEEVTLRTTHARIREAEAARNLAEARLARATRLHADGLTSKDELEEAELTVERDRADHEAVANELERIVWARRQAESEHRMRLADYDRLIATLDAEEGQAKADSTRLEYSLSERVVRAPVGGRIARMAPLRPGSVVEHDEIIAVVVPGGHYKAVAFFEPHSAAGRVRAGQRARMRLDAFPWIEYGQLDAEVSRVARETADELIRVELTLIGRPTVINLEHGITGTVAVEVERVSPSQLVLRAAGRRIEGTR